MKAFKENQFDYAKKSIAEKGQAAADATDNPFEKYVILRRSVPGIHAKIYAVEEVKRFMAGEPIAGSPWKAKLRA